jgi:catechol 2,3-dioxygenase-like lactoylglutathione lyase family enzyme
VRVDALDHLVLTVRSIETTIAFYARVLGMEARHFGEGRVALHFGTQKLNLHQVDRPIDPHVRHATPGSADLCLLTRVPLATVVDHLAACGVRVIAGPDRRTGAQGPLQSVYFYDPDENLIEVANQLDAR